MDLYPTWSSESTVATDCTFHQIAPYIGRMKTSIARSLITKFTNPGDLVVDPFCGSGVVALEAAIEGREVLAGDWNKYAITLTNGKLQPPSSLNNAELELEELWNNSRDLLSKQDLRSVPLWVRRFFHRETLRNALAFRDACVAKRNHFHLACLLGILHHQRPGFLSYPSSHLVPYLRTKKFPREQFPTLYSKRDVYSRLVAKVRRTYRRPPNPFVLPRNVVHVDARRFPDSRQVDAIITSPPYMNELDYVRDNRLRLWFVEKRLPTGLDLDARNREHAYVTLLNSVCSRLAPRVRSGGYVILVVGEAGRGRGKPGNTAQLTQDLFASEKTLGAFNLHGVIQDKIPDIRRSRRQCRGTKSETFLIYQKTKDSGSG